MGRKKKVIQPELDEQIDLINQPKEEIVYMGKWLNGIRHLASGESIRVFLCPKCGQVVDKYMDICPNKRCKEDNS